MTDSTKQAPHVPEPPSRTKLAWASLVALLVSGILLVAVVLPAEYNLDPLGTGAALGLIVLSDPASREIPVRSDGLTAQPSAYRIDRRAFELEPGAFVEYKYRLEAGEAMVYSWTASNTVRSEMHSEPDGAPEGEAEFFEVEEEAREGKGSYVAPFPGDHGWYWLNEGDATVTVTIYAAGFFHDSIEYPQNLSPILREMTVRPADEYAENAGGDVLSESAR